MLVHRFLWYACLLASAWSICEDFLPDCKDWYCASTSSLSLSRNCPVTCGTEATECPPGSIEDWPFVPLATSGMNSLCTGTSISNNNAFSGRWWDCQQLCQSSPACVGYNFLQGAESAQSQCETFSFCELQPGSGMKWRVAKRPAGSSVSHVCGDGIASGSEQCDGTDFATHVPSSRSYGDCSHLDVQTCNGNTCTVTDQWPHGKPTCKADCTVSNSSCYKSCPNSFHQRCDSCGTMVNVEELTSSFIGYTRSAPWENNFAGSSSGTPGASGLVSCANPLHLNTSGNRFYPSSSQRSQIATSRYGNPEKGSQCSLQCPTNYMALENTITCCNGQFAGTVKCGMVCEDFAPYNWCQSKLNECESSREVRLWCRKTCTAQCKSLYAVGTAARYTCLESSVSLCGQYYTDLQDVGTDRFQGVWVRTNPTGGALLTNLAGIIPEDISRVSTVTLAVENRVNVTTDIPPVDQSQVKGFVYGSRIALSDGKKFASGTLKMNNNEWNIAWHEEEVWTRQAGNQLSQFEGTPSARSMKPQSSRWVKEASDGSAWRDKDFPANSVGTQAQIDAWQAEAPQWAPVGLTRSTVDKVPEICKAPLTSPSSPSPSPSPSPSSSPSPSPSSSPSPPQQGTTSCAQMYSLQLLPLVGALVSFLMAVGQACDQ